MKSWIEGLTTAEILTAIGFSAIAPASFGYGCIGGHFGAYGSTPTVEVTCVGTPLLSNNAQADFERTLWAFTGPTEMFVIDVEVPWLGTDPPESCIYPACQIVNQQTVSADTLIDGYYCLVLGIEYTLGTKKRLNQLSVSVNRD